MQNMDRFMNLIRFPIIKVVSELMAMRTVKVVEVAIEERIYNMRVGGLRWNMEEIRVDEVSGQWPVVRQSLRRLLKIHRPASTCEVRLGL
jgi:hypothetical protein